MRKALLGMGSDGEALAAPASEPDPPATPAPTEKPAAAPAPAPATAASAAPAASADPAPDRSGPTSAPATRGRERAARIWQVVQAWNNAPERRPEERIAISASTLERGFGLFRPVVKAFLKAHQAEIDQHHQ